MDILLINANPVVSRMIALSTRDEVYRLEEVSDATQVQQKHYDIVFVDDGAYTVAAEESIDRLDSSKKVFLSLGLQEPPGFDRVIRKPFLPSEIMELIEADKKESIDEGMTEADESNIADDQFGLTFGEYDNSYDPKIKEEPQITPLICDTGDEAAVQVNRDASNDDEDAEVLAEPTGAVLDSLEVEKIKALLKMDDEEQCGLPIPEILSTEEYEALKIEAIKEDLIAQGLEIVDEETFVEDLGTNDEVLITKKKNKKSKKSKSLTPEELEMLEMMFAYTIRKTKPKKLRKLLKGEKVKLKLKDTL